MALAAPRPTNNPLSHFLPRDMTRLVEHKAAPSSINPAQNSFFLEDSDAEPLGMFKLLPFKRKSSDSTLLGRYRRMSSRSKLNLTSIEQLPDCAAPGQGSDAREQYRERETCDDYEDLSRHATTQHSAAVPFGRMHADLPAIDLGRVNHAEFDMELLQSSEQPDEEVFDLTPFSLIDDERWGTGMSATLPFLSSGDVNHQTLVNLGSHQNDLPQTSDLSEARSSDASLRKSINSIDEPPPQYARHDPTTPTMEDLPPIVLRSDVDQTMSQVEYERARGLTREDSAIGLTWRNDLSAWERKVDKKKMRSQRSSATSDTVSEPSSSPITLHHDRNPFAQQVPTLLPTPPTSNPNPASAVMRSSAILVNSISANNPTSKLPTPLPSPSVAAESNTQQKAPRVTFTEPLPKGATPAENQTKKSNSEQKLKSVPKKRSDSPRSSTLDRALYKAIYTGDLEKAQQLLRMGTNADIVHANNGILSAAAMWGHARVGKTMQGHQVDNTRRGGAGKCPTCHMSATDFDQDVHIVRALLAHGVDAKLPGGLCGTPLATAAWMGKTDIVAALLAAGADPAQAGGKYRTALCAATAGAGFAGNLNVVKVLVQAGAVVHAFGPHGSALSLAMKRRDFWLQKADDCPSMPDLEKRIASCDLMVRFLERAETEVRNTRKIGSTASSPEPR